ncbi:Holin-like protein CidA [Paraburkholderia domus]|uniref:CidA/LrgA family protein n=1 Tax=Paraburkholderia domus TaxID=2793075 RepID=UPI001B08C6D2|nr:Holin-like protein CidA [Paraburkholderia domus]CAE6850970.1 Holin-like protein CidA [Paraburkholderia domus]CAE6867111.1 Holin-like protein CidA [Paraburkholderia domus]CAE6913896.1 Holin-like protein CidA [Paraburkholderia domus]CAE6942158.1 Holin-like protein CidA [Paraburkholderia domus]
MKSATKNATATPVDSKPAASREATIVQSFAVLLAFQCLGELIAYVTQVPIPGPVIGMVLFLCLLSASPALAQRVDYVSRGLLNHLSLLFVPAGVGVMALAGAMKGQLIAISLAIVVSTILSIAVSALVAGKLMARLERKQQRLDAPKPTHA